MTHTFFEPERRASHRRLITALLAASTLLFNFAVAQTARAQADATTEKSSSSSVDQPIRPSERFDSLIDAFGAADSPARAISLLYRMDALSNLVPAGAYREGLKRARQAVSHPTAQFAVTRRLHEDNLDRDLELSPDASIDEQLASKKTALWDRAACLTTWRMVGPFDNDAMDGFEAELGPETGETGPYQGKKREIRWRPFPDYTRGCHLLVGRAVQPASSSVVYLERSITAKTKGSRRLLVGANGAYRIWLNGEMVAERTKDRGFAADARVWRLPLNAGENKVLVKLGATRTGSLSLMARVLGPNLGAPNIERDTAEDAPPDGAPDLATVNSDADPTPTGQGRVEQIEACAKNESLPPERRVDCLVTWSSVESLNSAEPWEDIADNLIRPLRNQPGWSRGPFSDPKTTGPDAGSTAETRPNPALGARAIARLARVYDSTDDSIDVLRVAHHRAPHDPVIVMKLATAESASLEDTANHRRKRRLQQIRKSHPEMWTATTELAEWFAAHGFGGRALNVVETLEVDDKMSRPAVVSQLANLESRYGTSARARELNRRAAQLNRAGTGWVRRQVDEHLAAGDRKTAMAWVDQQMSLYPWSIGWRIRHANIQRSRGHLDAAIATAESMLREIPGATHLHRYKAELLAAADRREEAIATLETALEYAPQNQRLRDYLSYLQPSEKGFHEPWMIENVRTRASNQESSGHAIDTILNQTVVRVSPNGLSQRVVQIVKRVNTSEGVSSARSESVSFRSGDEYVDVLSVKVHKPDGRVLESFNTWTSGGSRKGSSYYNDMKYRNIRADNVASGDLVEFRYRLKQSAGGNFRGDYFGDLSYIQQTRPVGMARYVVEAPETWELHFNPPKHNHEEITSRPGDGSVPEGFRVHGFEVSDVPAVKTDPNMPGYTDVYDYLMVSNKETWDEIGQWWWDLIDEQLITSDPIKQKVDELTKGLSSDRAKMEAIHNWVVKNTRYLHVGLGVHGWKPYKTTRAFKNKFGDCKDKSSLLKVMLEEAGIPTRLVLVRTRDLGHVETRPASMHIFNHAITYVPQFDLYLDPTAEFNGTTELTPMDQGAQGLIVHDGGEANFVTLPIDEPKANRLTRRLTVELPASPAGETGAEVTGELVATGQNAVYYRSSLEDPDRRDQNFEKQLADTYTGATLRSATYRNLSNLEKSTRIEFSFRGGRFLRGSTESQFVYPYGTERDLLSSYAKQSERQQDLTIRVPFVNETEITYQLPEGRKFGRVPENVEMTSDFGMLSIAYERDDDRARSMTVDIRYSLAKQRIPVERYDEFRSFLSKLTDELNRTIPVEHVKSAATSHLRNLSH